MKKGFTLIELLAVIVILAVIALIATPIILGIIEDTRKSSKDESVKLYLDTLKKSIAIELTTNPSKDIKLVKCVIQSDGSTICNNSKINIEIDNNPLIGGNIILDNGKITSATGFKLKNYDNVYKFENNTLIPIDICFYTSLNDDNTLSIAGYNPECGTDVVIPSSLPLTSIESLDTEACINGLVATGVDEAEAPTVCKVENPDLLTYLNMNRLTNVATISKSNEKYNVTGIGFASFASNNLTSIIIPNSVTSIDDMAFSTNNLTSINIPDSVETIGNSAFYDNQISSLIIGRGLKTITNSMFSENSLTHVEIPDNIETIDYGAFDENNITSVVIGSGIKSIDREAFGSSTGEGYGPNKIESVTINTTKDKVTIDSTSFNWVSGKSNEDIKWAG